MSGLDRFPGMLRPPADSKDFAALVRGGEIHVWEADVPAWKDSLPEFQRILSAEEQKRASAFVFGRDRERFVTCRGLLRSLLAGYLGLHPSGIELRYGRHGKPALDAAGPINLEFNVSHSDSRALLVFCTGRKIGVDIERIKSDLDPLELGRQVFSPAELEELRSYEDNARADAFFSGWTRKEALIKALGQGVSAPLRAITIQLRPLDEAKPTGHRGGIAGSWSILSLPAPEGYKAALAVEGPLAVDLIRRTTLPG